MKSRFDAPTFYQLWFQRGFATIHTCANTVLLFAVHMAKKFSAFFPLVSLVVCVKISWFNRSIEYFLCRFTITKEMPILWAPSIFYEYINVHTYIRVRICARTKLFVIYKYLIATISTQSRTEFTQVASIFPLLPIFKISRHQSRLTYVHISMETESKK